MEVVYLVSVSRFMSDEDRVSTVSSPKTKTETETETETETGGFQDQDRDQDSEVPRPRPRSRLVKTGLETSRDQDSSLENSKSGIDLCYIKLQTLLSVFR